MKRVYFFVRGLKLPIRLYTHSLFTIGRCFVDVSNHIRVIVEIQHEGREGLDKRPNF